MLFPDLQPKRGALPEGIDLRCCDVAEVLAVARGARLVIADAPWRYDQQAGVANPEDNSIFAGLSESEIVNHLDACYDCCERDARLAAWFTWPKEEEWRDAGHAGPRWGKKKSGGAWTKMLETSEGAKLHGSHPLGVGHHWRGQTEPVALFTRGACGRPNIVLLNGHVSPGMEHSYKPVEWQRAWIRAWTSPGDLVLDLYAGLGSVAVACALEGRRYIGAEIDPERHRRAVLRVEEAYNNRR